MITFEASDRQVALAQAVTYGYLARALMAPDEMMWHDLRDVRGPALAGVEAEDDRLARAIQAVLMAVARTRLDEARAARGALFPPVETPDCPMYESAYRGRDAWSQADLMADVAGFYSAYGLRWGTIVRERPDHIGVELEFMGIVATREADALARDESDHVQVCRATGDAFLRDHLGCWGIAFGRRVAELSSAAYLRTTGELLVAWLETELAARSIEPVESVDRPGTSAFERSPLDDDLDGCVPGMVQPPLIPIASIERHSSEGRAER